MTDYNSLKVPDLKKMLGDRSLPLSGNKADLIARLQEDDKKPKSSTAAVSAPPAEDEIDWDEDDTKVTTAPVATTVVAADTTPVANPVAVPNQKLDVDPTKTNELKVSGAKEITASGDEVNPAAEAKAEVAAAPVVAEAPKADYSIGLKQTDAEKEAEKRAARAKRFGITEDDDEKKKLERARKFGTDKEVLIKGLDNALPERMAKRGRDGDKQGGRAAKRQTPDRRMEVPSAKGAKGARPAKPSKPARHSKPARPSKPAMAKTAAPTAQKGAGRVQDDPSEKAKAEARAKRFETAA